MTLALLHRYIIAINGPMNYTFNIKAVGRGDQTTRRVRVQVLALLENPRRDRVRVLALLQNLVEMEYEFSSSRKPSTRSSTQSMVRGSSHCQWTSLSSFH
jgi:hypothetical protein